MKALDTRIIDAARVRTITISPNVTQTNPNPESEAIYWGQQATIDYELVDADGAAIGQRVLTHQLGSGEVKPTLAQALNAVATNLRAWIAADRIAIADNDAEAVAKPVG